MPSELVNGVRALIRAREEEGRPLSHAERVLLLATLAPRRQGGEDAVDQLEAAIAHARRILLPMALLGQPERRALTDLLAAARGVLDHEPPETPSLPPTPDTTDAPRRRADLDG